MSLPPAVRAQEGSPRRRAAIAAVCCSSLFVVTLDLSMVNVALPSIGADLGGRLDLLQWVVDAYTLVLAAFLVLGGTSADRFGRRRVFQLGLLVFASGSALSALAPSAGLLIAARVVQAVGGAMLNPVALSIITTTFPDRRARGRAIGAWGAVTGLSFGLGPLVGGLLTDAFGWRSVFWVDVPLCGVMIGLTAALVPESRSSRVRRIDVPGQLLAAVGLGALVLGLIEVPRAGWSGPWGGGAILASAVVLLVFLLVESRVPDPLLDLRFFRSPPFSAAVLVAVLVYGSWSVFLLVVALELQSGRGFTAVQAGLAVAAAGPAMLVLSPVAGAVAGARGPVVPLVAAGSALLAAGAWLGLTWSAAVPVPAIAGAAVVLGAAFGLANPAVSNTAVSGMPAARAGAAAAIASSARQVGASIGVALVGSVIGVAGSGAAHQAAAQARPLWWGLAAAGAGVVAAGLLLRTARARRSAERTRALVDEADVQPAAAPRRAARSLPVEDAGKVS